jgi:GNAT superfamily N-acetyltransferase
MNIRVLTYPEIYMQRLWNRVDYIAQLLDSMKLFRRCLVTQRSKDARQKQLSKLRGIQIIPTITLPKITNSTQKQRISVWKWNKIKEKFSSTSKQQKLQIYQRTKRRSIVDKNRGLYFSGIFNEKTNLGNHLHITESLLSDLDRCPSAALQPHLFNVCNSDLSLVSTVGVPSNTELVALLYQAEMLLKSSFSKQNLVVDLIHTWEDQFATSLVTFEGTVIAVTEYATMQKYLWIESIAVDEKFRKRGIGRYIVSKYCILTADWLNWQEYKKSLCCYIVLSLRFHSICHAASNCLQYFLSEKGIMVCF